MPSAHCRTCSASDGDSLGAGRGAGRSVVVMFSLLVDPGLGLEGRVVVCGEAGERIPRLRVRLMPGAVFGERGEAGAQTGCVLLGRVGESGLDQRGLAVDPGQRIHHATASAIAAGGAGGAGSSTASTCAPCSAHQRATSPVCSTQTGSR